MRVQPFDITSIAPWAELQALAASMPALRLEQLFAGDKGRTQRYQLNAAGLSLDYSRNIIDSDILAALMALAEQSPLAQHREAMFRGRAINTSEQSPVLHTALRASPEQLQRDGQAGLIDPLEAQRAKIREVSDRIRSGSWLGVTGKPITDIVNLGIGGSALGPGLACEALKAYAHPGLRCHFVANVDGEVIRSTLKSLDPETTLVVMSSKTFTTHETLLNGSTAAAWLAEGLGLANPYASPHVIGVTAHPENARALGLVDAHILTFDSWVGGRYSLWSAIGLPVAIAIGYDNFTLMLDGARAMDEHFRQAPWRENMPVILALLGIWYTNFLDVRSHAVVPYCERLKDLPFYLQQLDMESNGKSVTLDGRPVGHATGPLIWGTTGTSAQHSFFQWLHQGTQRIPVDFIGQRRDELSSPEHHRVLVANLFAQAAALMTGRQDDTLPPFRRYPGNGPSNILLMDTLTPDAFGALLTLYEHKVFVQGCLWHINSFDQWGVELGKTLARDLLDSGLLGE